MIKLYMATPDGDRQLLGSLRAVEGSPELEVLSKEVEEQLMPLKSRLEEGVHNKALPPPERKTYYPSDGKEFEKVVASFLCGDYVWAESSFPLTSEI